MPASIAAAFEMAKHSKSKSKVSGQSLVGPGFPGMGSIQPSHMGSQSNAPIKEDNYLDTNTDAPPIDRGAYGPGY